MTRVLITSVGTATSVGLVKAFREHMPAAELIGTDTNPYGHTAGSLMVDEFRQVPPAADERFGCELMAAAERLGVDWLVPVNDLEIEVLSRCAGEGVLTCRCLVPGVETISLVRDKARMTGFAASLGVPCPERVACSGGEAVIARDVHGVGSRGVCVIHKGETMPLEVSAKIASGEAFLQEFLPGDEYTVDVLLDEGGRALYAVPRRRVEVKAGVATKVEIVEDGRLVGWSVAVCESIGMRGFANVQFREGDDGTPRFIEVNPRFGGCSIASLMAAPGMFPAFIGIMEGEPIRNSALNAGVIHWGAVVTRYYEERMYLG